MQKPTIWWIIGITNNIPSGKHTKNYGKSQLLMGKYTISMAIFNSYVSLPEGNRGLSRMGHQHVAIKHVETKVWTNYWTRHVVLLRHPFHGDSYPHSALDLAISHLPFGSYYNRHSQKKQVHIPANPHLNELQAGLLEISKLNQLNRHHLPPSLFVKWADGTWNVYIFHLDWSCMAKTQASAVSCYRFETKNADIINYKSTINDYKWTILWENQL